MNRDTICFVCGNNVKFVNLKDKRESVLASPGDGIGALAVNPSYSNFAFAELKVNPKVFVYAFPDFSRPRSTLEGEEAHVHLDVTLSSSKWIMSVLHVTPSQSMAGKSLHPSHEHYSKHLPH